MEDVVMRRVFVAGLAALVGCLLIAPTPGSATSVTVDSIIWQSGIDASVYSVLADFTLSGNTLTITLTNTSGSTGVAGSTNLLTGLAFTLPTGVTISNSAANTVSLGLSPVTNTTSTAINGSITDATWGAASGSIASINNITGALGTVNAGVSTLQAQIDFDLNGVSKPPTGTANVDGPGFGILSNALGASSGGLAAAKDTLTFTLLLSVSGGGTLPADLITQINNGFVV